MGTDNKEPGPSIPAVTERHHVPLFQCREPFMKSGTEAAKGRSVILPQWLACSLHMWQSPGRRPLFIHNGELQFWVNGAKN